MLLLHKLNLNYNNIITMEDMNELIKKIQELNKADEYNKVIELLPAEILEQCKSADLYAEKAKAFSNLKQYQECKQAALEGLKLDNKKGSFYFYLGLAHSNLKEYSEAEEYYMEAIKINPLNSNYHNNLGNVYYKLKEYEKAKEYYLGAIKINSQNSSYHNNLGNVYYNSKDYEKAKECYLKAMELSPENASYHETLGLTYDELGDYQNAEKYYLKAIELNPEESNYHNNLGNVYYNSKDYEKAKECYLKAIELNSENASHHGNLGFTYYKLGDYQNAEKYYLKAIELNPEESNYHNSLGNIYHSSEEYEKAEKCYLEAIRINAKNKHPYYNLGLLCFNEQNNFEEAKKYFEDFKKLKREEEDIFYKRATNYINEIKKILKNSSYKKINGLINQLKSILLFQGNCITHYTGISTLQFLVLKDSSFRLSEGSFLNDTSEGQELFNFLEYSTNANTSPHKEIFTQKPFIGSFVEEGKNNDLTLWRMYGKEALEEAKGCSITINAQELKNAIQFKINPDNSLKISNIDFYRIAYRKNNIFDFAGSDDNSKKGLNEIMQKLKKEIESFKKKKNKYPNEETQIVEKLNEIAYLFKSVEYQYENEVRLVINDTIGFEKKVDFDENNLKPYPSKVYIELVKVPALLKNITIGPKVDKAEEWAATFHYHLQNKGFNTEIVISKLPFK